MRFTLPVRLVGWAMVLAVLLALAFLFRDKLGHDEASELLVPFGVTFLIAWHYYAFGRRGRIFRRNTR